MLLDLIAPIATAVFFFIVGAAVGANNVPTCGESHRCHQKAFAEANAQDTLSKITAHKAS